MSSISTTLFSAHRVADNNWAMCGFKNNTGLYNSKSMAKRIINDDIKRRIKWRNHAIRCGNRTLQDIEQNMPLPQVGDYFIQEWTLVPGVIEYA